MAAFANVIENVFMSYLFMGAVQRQGKGSILGIDNNIKAVQKRAETEHSDIMNGAKFALKRLILLNLKDGSIYP